MSTSLSPATAPIASYDAAIDADAFHQNHLDSNASFSGFLYETYGPEFEYVCQLAQSEPDRKATVVECDGKMYLAHGLHWVNRLGCHVFRNPVPFSPRTCSSTKEGGKVRIFAHHAIALRASS